jgi:hypothetical protein
MIKFYFHKLSHILTVVGLDLKHLKMIAKRNVFVLRNKTMMSLPTTTVDGKKLHPRKKIAPLEKN